MTATVTRQQRPTLPLISLVVAGAAATLSVIAITTDHQHTAPTTVATVHAADLLTAHPAATASLPQHAQPNCLTRIPVPRC
jgi:hypothetical protein